MSCYRDAFAGALRVSVPGCGYSSRFDLFKPVLVSMILEPYAIFGGSFFEFVLNAGLADSCAFADVNAALFSLPEVRQVVQAVRSLSSAGNNLSRR